MTRAQYAYNELEERIVTRQIEPGARLVEDAIADDLGLSRTPVREALRQLEQGGWIQMQPHAGAIVTQPNLEQLRDLMRLREVLEGQAVRLAVRRATEADIQRLRTIARRGAKAAASSRRNVRTKLGSEFHHTLTEATHNPLLKTLLDQVYKRVQWYVIRIPGLDDEQAWSQHEAIVDAIEARDTDQAAVALTLHVERTQAAIMNAFLEER
ncbi:MAG: GntR family transcriptional regulator [Actinobacteria bacterium]|nr:GntR family transcriptional regulator [Actinomycetota bacterium]